MEQETKKVKEGIVNLSHRTTVYATVATKGTLAGKPLVVGTVLAKSLIEQGKATEKPMTEKEIATERERLAKLETEAKK
mgnify:CR=1 FL=1